MPFSINCRGRLIEFTRPAVMGILNVTPDSFFAGSRNSTESLVSERVGQMLAEGADIIDIGGCSTRPGFSPVDAGEELRRVMLGIEAVRKVDSKIPISVDTYVASVARQALDAGADIVNDVSGFSLDGSLRDVVVERRVPYILTHFKSDRITPTVAGDELLAIVIEELAREIERLTAAGVADIWIDPGFGFGKTVEQNHQIIHRLEDFHILGRPLLVGISRKSMIFRPLGITPDEALPGTVALNALSLLKGASVLRVHDVAAGRQTVDILFQ